uniref:Uncharacterized protein n=1 Tax=Globodera pallida TaxID=36090 RepID=A0A183BWG5_GLOPA
MRVECVRKFESEREGESDQDERQGTRVIKMNVKCRNSREFPLPKVRDSFTRQFFDTISSNRCFSSPAAAVARDDKRSSSKSSPASDGVDNDGTKKLLPMLGKRKLPFLLMNNLQVRTRQAGQSTSKHTLGNLVEESNKQRSLLADPSQQQVAGVSGWIRAAISGATRRRREQQHTFRQMQTQQQQQHQQPNVGEHIKENGDLHPAADTAPKDAAAQQMKAPTDAIDIKALQRKRAQAEFTRWHSFLTNFAMRTRSNPQRVAYALATRAPQRAA